MTTADVAQATAAGDRALRMAGLLTRFNLHPESQIHPSWLPGDWPVAYRSPSTFGDAGRQVLSDWLRSGLPDPQGYDAEFTSPRKRLALLDASELRLLAVYCGFGTHRALLRQRGLGTLLRRQLGRFGPGTAHFVLNRMPDLDAFTMNTQALQQRPLGAARQIVRRGARLLLALLAEEGPALLERTRLKLPRRLAAGTLPSLSPAQRSQLDELIQLSIVPEKAALMSLAFLITSDKLQLLSERKVLKEAEYAVMLEAEDVIAAANQEAQHIRETASQQAVEERERGYQDGLAQGAADQADGMLDAAQAGQRQLHALRDAMARLVTRSVLQIVADADVAKVFESALSRVESLVRDEAFVSVRVSPPQEDGLRRALQSLSAQHGWTLKVAIQADPALPSGACVMHTASGTLDLSVQAQVDAFRRALEQPPP